MKNVVKPLAKIVLMLIGLTAAISATDAAIQKKKKKKIYWIRYSSINYFK